MEKSLENPKRSLVEIGFLLDKRINTTLAIGGTAVMLAFPAVAAPAALVAAGSIANMPVSSRLERLLANPDKKKQ